MPLLMAHPKTFSFYGDMFGASLIFGAVVVFVVMALNAGADSDKLLRASLPLSILFAALVHSLGQRIIAFNHKK